MGHESGEPQSRNGTARNPPASQSQTSFIKSHSVVPKRTESASAPDIAHGRNDSRSVQWRRGRRILAAAAVLIGILLGGWSVAAYFAFVDPAADHPSRADAVVVLAPPLPTGRFDYAKQLMSEDYANTLVISVPKDSNGVAPTHLCQEDHPYKVICFTPDPVTTQGEARVIQRLAKEHNWNKINVVTNDFHVTRARMIIERCYSHDLNMVAARQDLSWRLWANRCIYESAAFVKAILDNSC